MEHSSSFRWSRSARPTPPPALSPRSTRSKLRASAFFLSKLQIGNCRLYEARSFPQANRGPLQPDSRLPFHWVFVLAVGRGQLSAFGLYKLALVTLKEYPFFLAQTHSSLIFGPEL